MDLHRLTAPLVTPLEASSAAILTTSARLVFFGVLFFYFWQSGLTKVGEGVFGLFRPDIGAYVQIFPRTLETVGYDPSQLGLWQYLVVVAGTVAEFVLPILLVIGLFTRLAAFGMIGFVVVQSLTDLYGHNGFANGVLGAWFDPASDALIADQRAFWVLLLAILVLKGGGPLSVDRWLFAPKEAEPAYA